MFLGLWVWLAVAGANPDTGMSRPCGYWGDMAQSDRNEAIAWEAVRQYTAVHGGLSKNFARTVVEQASEEAASLPVYTYNYSKWFATIALEQAEPGHVLQIEAPMKRTAVIVDMGSGWVEIVGSSWDDTGKSGRFSVNLLDESIEFTIYEIGTGMCSD